MQWVCQGPVFGTDWCVLPDPDPAMVAPGGVVLCLKGTNTPHPDARQAAESAWEVMARITRVGLRPARPFVFSDVFDVDLSVSAVGPQTPTAELVGATSRGRGSTSGNPAR